jgi:hypothetical protein
MRNLCALRRVAGWTSILGIVALGVDYFLLHSAMGWSLALFADPQGMLSLGSERAALIQYGMTFNALAYLLAIPLYLYLRHWLYERSPDFVDLYAVGLILYAAIGTVTTGFLWLHWPALINAYTVADESQREFLEILYSTVAMSAQGGMYGVELVPGGIGLLGFGNLLRRESSWQLKVLGVFAMINGFVMLLIYCEQAIGTYLLTTGLTWFSLYITPLWDLWLGIYLIREGFTTGRGEAL